MINEENKILTENIDKYYQIQQQIKALKEEADNLKLSIINNMGDNKKYETSTGRVAQLIEKETFTYNNELGIIQFLEDNDLNQFIIKKVNATVLNKELKKNKTLCEGLKDDYTKNTVFSLTVK